MKITEKAKYILVATSLLAVVAGCSKHERGGGQPLTFSVKQMATNSEWTPLSKADAGFVDGTNVTNIPVGKRFGVFGWHHMSSSSADGEWTGSDEPNFMFNQWVENVAADNASAPVFNYSPVKYWPNQTGVTATSAHIDKISFWAYYPHNGAGISFIDDYSDPYTNASTGQPRINFTVQNNQANQVDLLVAPRQENLVKPAINTEVEFDFHHALSQISFSAKTLSNYADYTFTVKKVEVLYSYNTAVYDIDSATPWANYSNESVTGVVAFEGSIAISDVARAVSTSPLLLIPQNLQHAVNEVSIRVTYDQSSSGSTVTKIETAPMYNASVPKWEEGKKYSYCFSLSVSSGFHLKVEVQDWVFWKGTATYEDNVTVTKQLVWDSETYESITNDVSFTIDGETKSYDVIVLKPGVNLLGTFCFDTPYGGTWYAMLETVNDSNANSIVFSDNNVQIEGLVGGDINIGIKSASPTVSRNQYSRLRFMCRTQGGQVLTVQDATIGGPYIISQHAN